MNVLPRLGAAAAAALCALAVAAAAAATSAPPDPAQVLGPVAIPHGAAREDVSVVAPDPAIVSGKRWAAEVHRIGQSTDAGSLAGRPPARERRP